MKKKTRGKRLLSILLACIMMISLVPSTVFAVSPSSITLTEAGKTPVQIIINDELTETTNDVDGKWTYTKSTNTLELKGWEGQKLYANGDLNLVLTDTNTITMATNDDFGIKLGNGGDGKLTVSGEGTLTIKGENLTQKAYGIFCPV